jgi:predicted transcriptional regulator
MTKEEFNARLKELSISQRDFSNIADISYSTINNWGFKVNEKVIPVPKWVKPFLDYYEKSNKYDYLLKEILKTAQSLEKK